MKKILSFFLVLCLMLPVSGRGRRRCGRRALCCVQGLLRDFNVTVTIAGGKIADIEWEGSMETAELGSAATEFKGGMIGFDFVNGSLPASGMNAVAMYCVSYT